MRDKVQNRKKKLLPAILAVALAAVLIAPLGSGFARAAEGGGGTADAGSYSLTVNLSESQADYLSDLKEAGAKVRIYQIASGEKNASYDTYDWTLISGKFDTDNIKDAFEKAQDQSAIDTSNENFINVAQQALKVIVAAEATADTADDISPAATGDFATSISLDPGIYLVVPVLGDTISLDDQNAVTLTTSEWVYTFNPMLISVPTKYKGDDPYTEDPRGTAADYGDWKNAVVINAKADRTDALTSISIRKILQVWEDKDPATFVFSIDAEKGGKNVYSNVVAIHMNQAGASETRVIEGIPVGAKVTVKEVYGGASYRFVSAKPALNPSGESVIDSVVSDGSKNTFEFTNTYDDTHHGGGGIENQFIKEGDNGVNPVRSKPAWGQTEE